MVTTRVILAVESSRYLGVFSFQGFEYMLLNSSFSRDVTTNYAMARAPEVGHAGGHSAGRVVSKQRPLGQLLRALCFKYRINGLYLCCKELWTQYC